MNTEQLTGSNERIARRYAYDDQDVLAVDFGASEGESTVDVADGTVIVVTGDEQREFELPDGARDAQAFMKNGVLTVELEGDR